MNIKADSIEEAINKIAFLIAQSIATESKQNLIKHGNVDTGMLLRLIKVEENGSGWLVAYPVPYAEDLEFGNIPRPETQYKDILLWVKRKLKMKGSDAETFAYFLTKRIREKGIKPSPFIRPAIYKVLNELK